MNQDKKIESRQQAIERHNIDSGIFQGRYQDFSRGRFTDEFIYGRYQMIEEVDRELSALPSGARIFDLGCGTGHFSNYMFNRGFEVHALDPSVKMLEFARRNFPDIHFVEGVATALPYPDHYFDFVISIEVLRYLDIADVKQAYAEIYRVLKPGGRMLITHVNTYAADGYYYFYHIKQWVLKLLKRPLHHCYFTTPEMEIRLVEDAGYSNVKTTGRMFGSIRIGYKFGKFIGRGYARLLELVNTKQLFTSGYSRAIAGHLILTASK